MRWRVAERCDTFPSQELPCSGFTGISQPPAIGGKHPEYGANVVFCFISVCNFTPPYTLQHKLGL
jgi:hypothetical protein